MVVQIKHKYRHSDLGGAIVGRDSLLLAGSISLGPSFYKGYDPKNSPKTVGIALSMQREGAGILDIGAVSTAPYLNTDVPKEQELHLLKSALAALYGKVNVPISIDTTSAFIADSVLSLDSKTFAVPKIINDVSGLKGDPALASVARDHNASLILMAHSANTAGRDPIACVRRDLEESLVIAEKNGIPMNKIVADPGIGFYRNTGSGRGFSPQNMMPWYQWDMHVITHLDRLSLGIPIGIAVSMKSFLNQFVDKESLSDRLQGSLVATAISIINGARLIRTHHVQKTGNVAKIALAMANA